MNEATAAIVSDLRLLVDQARWAHNHGYWKEGHGLDREHGADLSKTEGEREAGPTFDLNIGSHSARVAYQHAVEAVAHVDVLLASILLLEGRSAQRRLVPLNAYSPPRTLAAVADHAIWRAERVTGKHPQLTNARARLDKAVRGLSKALDRGGVPYTAHKDKPCRTCGIRDRATKKTECDTCATWRARHGGEARPKKLDEDSINVARAAQQRRLARAEGWGEA